MVKILGEYYFFHQLQLSMENRKWVSINASAKIDTCFRLGLRVGREEFNTHNRSSP